MTASTISAGVPAPPINRTMITVSVMLATIMTQLDTTIANVALPHMAGSVSASADQITWVLTSYIVAAAIMTPTSGWFAARLGNKRVFVVAIIGFTVASALCGIAQSLGQIVVFRVLQGMFGAAMMPLTQAVIYDIYPVEERGQAMSIWAVGSMVSPVAGPVLGGWLTEDFSWRWVFYINLPLGILALLGVLTFLSDDKHKTPPKFDAMGFALLGLGVAALQLCLDRGQGRGWFDSTEIVIEAAVAAVALLLFLIHTLTAERSFVPLALFKDRNFVGSTVLGFIVGMLVFSVLALLPSLMQNLMGYPVVTSGIVSAPRGVGSVLAMFFAGRYSNRFDPRMMMLIGLILLSIGFFEMSGFSLDMDSSFLVITGFIQGLGMGLIFMPMSLLVFTTLQPSLRADGAGVNALIRNLGNSIGISLMEVMYTRNSAAVHARLSEPIRADNPIMQSSGQILSLASPQGVAGLVGEVSRQASMVAYIDVFRLMAIITLVIAPLVLCVRSPLSIRTEPSAMVESGARACQATLNAPAG